MKFDIINGYKCIYLFGYKPIAEQGFVRYDSLVDYYSKNDNIYENNKSLYGHMNVYDSRGDNIGLVSLKEVLNNTNVKEYLLYHNPEFLI